MTNKRKPKTGGPSVRRQKRPPHGALGYALVFFALILGLSLLSSLKDAYEFKDRHGIDLFLAIFFYLEGYLGRRILGAIGWSVLPLIIGLLWTGIQQTGRFSSRPSIRGILGFFLCFFCILMTGAVLDPKWVPWSTHLGGDIGRILGSNLFYSLGKAVSIGMVVGFWGLLSCVIFGMWPGKVISTVMSGARALAFRRQRQGFAVQTAAGSERPADTLKKGIPDTRRDEDAEKSDAQATDKTMGTAIECQKRLENTPGYRQPPLEILVPAEPEAKESTWLQATAKKIESKLAEMNIEVTVQDKHPGPVITRYDVVLKRGQRLKTVLGAQQDLSLALGAPVRILSIARKGLVGIEVPNTERAHIRLGPLIEHALRMRSRDPEGVRVPVGLTPEGDTFTLDLCLTPHLLVAGTTGSGKSVFLNAVVTSLAYGYSPQEVRLVLVDPKMVEFSIFNHLPHLLHPVVTDAELCEDILLYLIEEMDRRYCLLADSECRDIRTFRHRIVSSGNAHMPYILVIIDEFADLFLAKTSDLETVIVRLAQKARAVGIHLVLATQRPSTDVVRGLIKANFPSRLAFKVSTGVDSRVILDEDGAESLLGNGDMLLRCPEYSGTRRLHGPYVSQEEIDAVMKFFREL